MLIESFPQNNKTKMNNYDLKQRGLTLIELIMVIIVLSVSFGAVITMMVSVMTLNATSTYSWQNVVSADNIMQTLLAKSFPSFMACEALGSQETTLCPYLGKKEYNQNHFFKEINKENPEKNQVIVEVKPYATVPQIAEITITLSHVQGNAVVLHALKAPAQ